MAASDSSYRRSQPDAVQEAAAWFRREDWGRWCEIDPDFQPDYSHWLRRMEKAVAQYQAAGTPIIKSIIVPDEFVAWAKANGKDFGSAARAEYAAHQAMEQDSLHKRTD